MITELVCGAKRLRLDQPAVMGILNLTPDSFSDGGELFEGGHVSVDRAVGRALQMVGEGAAIIDVGGESTRPGSEPISEQQELDRVCPVIARLARELDVVLSVDTSTARVMREAAAAGAGLINDVRALRRQGSLAAAVELGLPVCLMHMQGEPGDMQVNPRYQDVVAEVIAFLDNRIQECVNAGLERDKMLVDPGFGFGKTLSHNLMLLNRLERLQLLDLPVLVGLSRKSSIGAILQRPVGERLYGSLSGAVVALLKGARLFRVHDVGPTVEALRFASAVLHEHGDADQ